MFDIYKLIECTKKVVRFLDDNKVRIITGVMSMMTVTFYDGKVNISLAEPKKQKAKDRYADLGRITNATAAIDAFAATADSATCDSDKISCADKIVRVLRNTPDASDATKQHAIKTLGEIKKGMRWDSDKRKIDDHTLTIIGL